jgi:hypothetical protein
MPLVDRMPAVARHVMANNNENVSTVPHIEHARRTFIATEATASNVTYTPAQFLGGMIFRDTGGVARNDTTPSASAMLAAMPGAFVNQSIDVYIKNTSAGAFGITVLAGAGVTLNGTMTIAQNQARIFRLIVTAIGTTPTYTLVSLAGALVP